MTLVIGLRTREGIVLGADRRIITGERESFEEDKIFIAGLSNTIAVSTEGLTGLRDKFVEQTRRAMDVKKTTNLSETIEALEDVMYKITTRYAERFENGDGKIISFVVGLDNLLSGNARLYKIIYNGYAEEVRTFDVLGEGSPYARPLVKLLHRPDISLAEGIDICYFMIRTIEELELIQSVGGIPDILICRNNQRPTFIDQNEKEALSSRFDNQIQQTKDTISKLVSTLRPKTSP